MVLKKLLGFLINFTIFFLIVTFSPGLGPKTAFPFEEFTIAQPKALEGVLAPNKFLEHPDILYKGQLKGPEHILERDGVIYTSLETGEVVNITNGKIEVMSKFGKFCYLEDSAPFCGRPLGLAFDTKGNNLIVMDSSTGIFELNIDTNKLKIIVLAGAADFGEPRRESKLLNSVAVAPNGDIYFTDSDSNFEIHQIAMGALANPSGRLAFLERSKGSKKPVTLIDKLWFGNGVAFSPNQDFLVVSDLFGARILRYWLTTEKAGTYDVFADGLPGCPDNITPDEKGFWVPLVFPADSDHPIIFHKLTSFPLVRKFFSRILHLLETLFKKINKYYLNAFSRNMVAKIQSHATYYDFIFSKRATVLRFDWNGNIVAAYHSNDGSVYTHVMESDGKLYLGSYRHDYIARVNRRNHA